ncbi:MAG TPA: DUF6599 family protein [Polyangia bacterium]
MRARVAVALLLLCAAPALGRTPPIVADPRQGVWLGAGEVFVYQTLDRWDVFPAGATVNKLAVDDNLIWIATDDGVIRFDSGSRKQTRLTMDDGLPSQNVAAVAVDQLYVWFATNKGLVRYRKLDRTLRVYTAESGLPHAAVQDALTVGRQVWFATREGVAVYDPDTDGLRSYGPRDGLASGDVQEIFQVGDDLLLRTDVGLSRFRIKARLFTNWSFKDLGGTQIRSYAVDGDKVWIGTDRGLVTLETSSDAIVPFPQQSALVGQAVVGVELFTDYLFIATDKDLAQYHKVNRSIRRFTEADGLLRRAGASGTLLMGGVFTMMFPEGVWAYDVQRELWVPRALKATERSDTAWGVRLFGTFNLYQPFDLETRRWGQDRYATGEGGVGIGARFGGGRSLDLSLRLDYGQIEPLVACQSPCPAYSFQYRELAFKLEYLGNENDIIREIVASERFQYRTLEEGLERNVFLLGGQVRAATPGKEPKAQLTVAAGKRRGATVRDFLTGPRQEIYQLSQTYVIPGSERVYVDGEQLTNGVDYTMIYPAGQLAFLDPERVDDLSIIEVEYEHDLEPRKGLGVMSLLDMLPSDREVGDWTRVGQARLIREESGLYQQIDGAAPKYIDRGWQRSVYAEYRQGSRGIQVAIHDMGTESSSQNIYNYDLPPAREPVIGRDNLVIDVGLATAYAAKAHFGQFYIELSIDEKSDAAKQSLKLFAIEILDRGTNAGANPAGQVREWVAAARAAASPFRGAELGARVVEVWGFGPTVDGKAPRRFATGVLDGRYEREVGDKGRLTAYGELAGTHSQSPDYRDGWAAIGRMRLAHPWFDGTLSYRHHSAGYEPLGTDQTIFGKLRDELRFSGTAYPAQWLPTSGFFMHQVSSIDGGGTGLVQHALGRVQLTKDGLPATSLQIGHSELSTPDSTMGRVRFVGQTEYDLAKLVPALKRFTIRALYGLAQAETDEAGRFAHADRVQLTRIEAKLAPTNTESAYLLFRQRKVWRQDAPEDNFGLTIEHYELNAGARSAFVKGLIPQVNYSVLYDDDRVTQPLSVRSSRGGVAAQLGIYPGQWWRRLAPVVLEPRYSVANDAQAEGEQRTLLHRTHRFDNRAIYAGTGKLELELLQLYEESLTGEDQHRDGRKLELRNRIVVRPHPSSPFTARLNYLSQQTANDRTLAPGAPEFGQQAIYEGILEWLKRWSHKYTTKLKGSYSLGRTSDYLYVDPQNPPPKVQSYTQHRVGLETEVRVFPLEDVARLYVLQRNGIFRLFGDGTGSSETVDFYTGAGAIWVLGAKMYLDADVLYRKVTCLAQPCTPLSPLEMRLFLTFNL